MGWEGGELDERAEEGADCAGDMVDDWQGAGGFRFGLELCVSSLCYVVGMVVGRV